AMPHFVRLLLPHSASRLFFSSGYVAPLHLHSFPTRRSSDLSVSALERCGAGVCPHLEPANLSGGQRGFPEAAYAHLGRWRDRFRSEEHTSELQSRENLVCRLLLEKKKHTHKKHDATTEHDDD